MKKDLANLVVLSFKNFNCSVETKNYNDEEQFDTSGTIHLSLLAVYVVGIYEHTTHKKAQE